jgi:hypothetical protein
MAQRIAWYEMAAQLRTLLHADLARLCGKGRELAPRFLAWQQRIEAPAPQLCWVRGEGLRTVLWSSSRGMSLQIARIMQRHQDGAE